MTPLVDQSTDAGGRRLYRLSQAVGLPDFVRRAGPAELRPGPEAGPAVWADPAGRLFPCHTKAATWLSALYLLDQALAKEAGCDRGRAEHALARIRERARLHGIAAQVEKLAGDMREFHRADPDAGLTNADFALVLEGAGGAVERHYPLRNAREVKAASAYALKYRRELPFPVRRMLAERVLAKAAEHGASLPAAEEEAHRRSAGLGLCAAADAARLLLDRIDAVPRRGGKLGEKQAALAGLARDVVERPAAHRRRDSLLRLCEAVDAYDRSEGLRRHSRGLPLPEDELFALTHQKAAELRSETVETAAGALYRKADLEGLRARDLLAAGGGLAGLAWRSGPFVDSEKLAAALAGLSRPDALAFEKAAADRGVVPFARSAGGERVTQDDAAMRRMAEWVLRERRARAEGL